MIECMGLEQMGNIIRNAREKNEESQDVLSDRSGVSQGWLSQVELGHVANPSAQRIRLVAKALAIDPRILFAAQFDIPFGDDLGAPEMPRTPIEPPDDPLALAEQIAALTHRLALLAGDRQNPERPSRTSAGA